MNKSVDKKSRVPRSLRASTPCPSTRWCLAVSVLLVLWTSVTVSLTVGFVFNRLENSALRAAAAASASQRSGSSSASADSGSGSASISNTSSSTATKLLTCAESLTPECVSVAEIEKEWGVKTDQYDRDKCCAYHGEYRLMLTELEHFLRMQAVGHYVGGGALIGSLRHGGALVPWDYDLDLYVPVVPNDAAMTMIHLTETFVKLSAWDDVMPGSRYVLRPCAIREGKCITSWKLHRRVDKFENRLTVDGPRVDLFLLQVDSKKQGDHLVHVANHYWWNIWAVPPELVFPTAPCLLYGVSHSCPHRPLEYLELVYGPDVMKRADGNSDFWAVKTAKKDGPQTSMMQRVFTYLHSKGRRG